MPYGRKLYLLHMNYHIIAAKQEPYKKAYLAKKQTNNCNENFLRERPKKKKKKKGGPLAEK